MRKVNDLTGKVFWRLTVIEFDCMKNRNAYWLCKCECGNIKSYHGTRIVRGDIKSCGCLKGRPRIYRNNYEGAKKLVFKTYKRKAELRELLFDLSEKKFFQLAASNCYYCNATPASISKYTDSEFVYNGIDRVNNKIGYREDNVVSCCARCNKAKGTLSKSEFIGMALAISKNMP